MSRTKNPFDLKALFLIKYVTRMLGRLKILIVMFTLLFPWTVFADDGDIPPVQQETEEAVVETDEETNSLYNRIKDLGWDNSDNPERKQIYEKIESLMKDLDKNTDELRQNYENLKANEQSTANKTLTALSTAATGIGAMELLQGRAEQKADKQAEESMAAYIATMRCTYGDDKQVKAGPDEIELPGGNNADLMKYRSEYLALAADLKERKTALGMKLGIESEEILDKAATGLYDDENLGITSGAYASLYRAQMLGSEKDQSKIDADAKTSKNRVMGGAIAAGVGVIGGAIGNAIINKDAPKDKSQEIKAQRTKIKDEIKDFLQAEVDRCNNIIEENQQYAATLKSDTTLMQDENLKSYVESVEKLQKLTSVDDISVIKEHPLCK